MGSIKDRIIAERRYNPTAIMLELTRREIDSRGRPISQVGDLTFDGRGNCLEHTETGYIPYVRR